MKLFKVTLAAVLAGATMFGTVSSASAAEKNWTPPAYKIYGQTLADEMAFPRNSGPQPSPVMRPS
ncbi:MAG: hypothetical protein R3E69_13735 [Steroidobacteraceae bacterium]